MAPAEDLRDKFRTGSNIASREVTSLPGAQSRQPGMFL
jgi:hypothetical protein